MLDVAVGETWRAGVGIGREQEVTSVVVNGGAEAIPVSYVKRYVSQSMRVRE